MSRRGEMFKTRDGRIISLERARAEGRETRVPFDNGYAELRRGVLYPDRGSGEPGEGRATGEGDY